MADTEPLVIVVTESLLPDTPPELLFMASVKGDPILEVEHDPITMTDEELDKALTEMDERSGLGESEVEALGDLAEKIGMSFDALMASATLERMQLR